MEEKRRRGRPRGSKDSTQRSRATHKQLLKEAEKNGRFTKTYESIVRKLERSAATRQDHQDRFDREHRVLIERMRLQREKLVMDQQAANNELDQWDKTKVQVNCQVPIELASAFFDVVRHSPFTKTEIINNLILNFVKAYNGLSPAELEKLRVASLALEKTQYQATAMAGKFVAKNPELVIKHAGFKGNSGRKLNKVAPAIHQERPGPAKEYALNVDKPMTNKEMERTLENQEFYSYDDLFRND